MRKLMLLCACLCAVAFAVAAGPAQATNPRSWVSNSGSDSNTCTLASPCATFARAITETTAGGEVDCLTPGDFGSGFSITSSLTIDCGAGQVGAITGGGMSISAGSTGMVIIRNVTINGFANAFPGTVGILVTSVGKLVIEHCNIIGFPTSPGLGIEFTPQNSALLNVSDTTIDNNGSAGQGGGIEVAPQNGAIASVVLDGVKMRGNVYGMGLTAANGTIATVLRRSVIAGSAVSGIVVVGGPTGAFLTIEESSIVNNGRYGVQSAGSAVSVQIGGSTITGNMTGVSGTGLVSFKNNQIGDNATDGTPITAFPGPGGTPLQ